jgi:hypothetical protein
MGSVKVQIGLTKLCNSQEMLIDRAHGGRTTQETWVVDVRSIMRYRSRAVVIHWGER